MDVYVETNFVLELALLQEQHESCQKLLELAEAGQINLILPAFSFTPQDAIVYASVIEHLNQSTEQRRCFINRNSKDFDNPDIQEVLDRYNCRILFKFDSGFGYIKNQIGII